MLFALPGQLLRRLGGYRFIDDGVIGMGLWAAAQLDDLSPAWELARRAPGASGLSLGPLLAACEERRLLQGELRVLGRLARGVSGSAPLGAAAANAAALSLAQAGRPRGAARGTDDLRCPSSVRRR